MVRSEFYSFSTNLFNLYLLLVLISTRCFPFPRPTTPPDKKVLDVITFKKHNCLMA